MALNSAATSGNSLVKLSKPGTVGGHPIKYRGLDAAQRIIDNAKSGRTLVYFDPDVDGMVAGLFISQVLHRMGIVREAFANSNRAHGFLLNGSDYQGWTVLNGDFLVPRWKVEELVENGTSLLSLDHHELEDEGFIHETGDWNGDPVEAVVINNQYAWEDPDNHYQSGAGVTFEVLRELFPWMDTPTNRALVGLTLITDIRNLHNERAAGYLYELYNHKYEGYIKYLIHQSTTTKRGFGVPRMTRNFVDFTFGPKVNSLLRFNDEELGVKFILGAGYPDNKYHERQKEFVSELKQAAEITHLDHLTVIKIEEDRLPLSSRGYYSNFVGLLCSQYSGSGRSAIGYAVDSSGKVIRASFRGNLQDTAYRDRLEGIVDGRGHNIAFGVIGLRDDPELFATMDRVCGEAEEDTTYSQRYIEVSNMRTFIREKGSLLGDYNNYRMSSSRVHIRYTGNGAEILREGARYRIYSLNGIEVMCFNLDLDIDRDYIVVSLNNNRLEFVLQEPWNEDYAKRIALRDVNLSDEWWKNL